MHFISEKRWFNFQQKAYNLQWLLVQLPCCLLAPTWWTASKTALESINRHRSLGDLQSTWLRMIIFLGYFVFFFVSPPFCPLWESIISRAKCGENVGKPKINIASSSALNDFWVIRTTEFSKRSFIYIIMPRPEHFHLLIVTPRVSASAATQGCVLWSQSSSVQGPILNLILFHILYLTPLRFGTFLQSFDLAWLTGIGSSWACLCSTWELTT